jgi:hypothetical protein
MPVKDSTGQSTGNIDCFVMTNSDMVPNSSAIFVPTTMDLLPEARSTSTSVAQRAASTVQKTVPDGLSIIRERYGNLQISADVTEVLMTPWRPKTQKQYGTYLRRWVAFCDKRKVNYHSPMLNDTLEFLMELYKEGLSYSTINTARSALSTVVSITDYGNNPIVSRFKKGIFETRKPTPKYTAIWDVSVVLQYLSRLYPNETLSLNDLTHKVLMLLLLVSSQSGQTIHLLDLNSLIIQDDKYIFPILEHTKTSKPGKSHDVINVTAYELDQTLCPLACLKEYIIIIIILIFYIASISQRFNNALQLRYIKMALSHVKILKY